MKESAKPGEIPLNGGLVESVFGTENLDLLHVNSLAARLQFCNVALEIVSRWQCNDGEYHGTDDEKRRNHYCEAPKNVAEHCEDSHPEFMGCGRSRAVPVTTALNFRLGRLFLSCAYQHSGLGSSTVDLPLHALRHELKVVMPSMGARAGLVGSPFAVALLFLLTRSARITLVDHGCLSGSCFPHLIRSWRWSDLVTGRLSRMGSCVVLGALTPELGPSLPGPYGSSRLHRLPFGSARVHRRRVAHGRPG